MTTVVYKQIAEDLRARIRRGELAPGDDVPTEAELAQTWRTSRGPIRNALAELRQEGLIETGRGRPARVTPRKPHQAVDVSIPFTRWAREIGAQPGARTQEVALRKVDAEKATLLEVPEGTPVVDVLRLRSLDGRPAMLERLTFLGDVGRALFDTDLDTVSITEYLESRGHRSFAVEHEIDAVAADAVDARLLGVAVGSPILRLRRISHDGAGRVFEASDDRYLPDVIRFTVTASGRSRAGDAYVRPLRAL
ncbi:GntR family transcriptional regulator [Microbacterium gorillae]|uniref:GntR family transcriptional regulator n=1 Tax=Microbacterium gorillae TaxID=1231063 RepID=UPI0005909891|nr:GntR family transcriptional regulator [Microbacterium gorillae]